MIRPLLTESAFLTALVKAQCGKLTDLHHFTQYNPSSVESGLIKVGRPEQGLCLVSSDLENSIWDIRRDIQFGMFK